MINISKRLATVASLILNTNSKGIIDVGCDHALLDIYLVLNNPNLKVIASDINEGPLLKAKENVYKYGLEDKIKLVLGDGLDTYEDVIDTVVISGMGSETIIEILNKNKDILNKLDRLIICSNNKYDLLRKEVTSLGFSIEDEKIVYDDNKYYIAISFIKGKNSYSELEYFLGPILLKEKDEVFINYLKSNLKKREELIKSIPKYISKDELEKEIKLIKNALFI